MEKHLVDLSGLADPILKAETIKFIRKNGITRPIQKLVQLLNHPCSQEQIENINKQFSRKYYEAGDAEGLIKPFARDEILESMAHDSAEIIGKGFDIAFKDNLNVNSETGAVVVKRDPTTGQPDTRFQKCAAAEASLEMPSNESSAFKGSLQGLGRKRKTRKHSKKARKTLRRHKVRRNMH